ncbi:uncharacterized protein [Clytia hemisphaerica]
MEASLLQQKLSGLRPELINQNKCTNKTSLHQNILRHSQSVLQSQHKKYNLGNGYHCADPLTAAEYLLQREYGETSLYDPKQRAPVIIPQVFNSNQYAKSSPVNILDYEIGMATMQNTLENLTNERPDYWFTKEMQAFYDENAQQSSEDIDKKKFDRWIIHCKIFYLTIQEIGGGAATLDLPLLTTSETESFVRACLAELASNSPPPSSKLKNILKGGVANLRQKIENLIKSNPPSDPVALWYFELNLAELGENAEDWFRNQFLALLSDEILHDTVILQSVKFMTNIKKKFHQEFDFLLLSWSRKLIIAVEIKRQSSAIMDAIGQLESYKQIFDKKLGDQLDNSWTFLPVICVEKNHHNLNQTQHYITFQTNIKSWLSGIFTQYPELPCTVSSLDQVKNVLRMIIFTIHVSKSAPVTTSNWVEYTSNAIESISTVENIVFYSNTQMHIMNPNEPRLRKLLIRGGYGTGKSFLLEEKAKQLSRDPHYAGNIVYVCWRVEPTSLLEWRLKLDLEEKHGVSIMGLDHNVGKGTQDLLVRTVRQKKVKALFFDEWKEQQYHDFFSWMLNETVFQSLEIIWIAFQGGKSAHTEKAAQQFTLLDLSTNFRNSRELVKEAKNVADKKHYKYKSGLVLPPPMFPSGRPPIYVNSFENAIKEMRKLSQSGILVIADTRTDGEHWGEHTVVLDKMNEEWKRYDFTDKDFKAEENPYEVLKNGNILLTDCLFIQGFEWVNVVSFREDANYIDYHDCNYFMRCNTNLIVIER